MSRAQDLTGIRFSRLLVIGKHTELSRDKHTQWVCLCDCGTKKIIARNCLVSKGTQSCGCLFNDNKSLYGKTHGYKGTVFYDRWQSMLRRCYSPKHISYPRYGGKGITVCERWRKFENFLADMNIGFAPELQLDRIDNSKGYEPGNCRWVSCADNCRNRSSSRLSMEDASMIKSYALLTNHLADIAMEFNVSKTTICDISAGRTWRDATPLIAY